MKTLKPILPDDIQKEVTISVLKKALPFVIVEILVIAFILLYGNESFKMIDFTVKMLIYVALVVLPIFIFKIHKLITDRTWKGEIIGINVNMGLVRSVNGRGVRDGSYLILQIKREDGKIVEHLVSVFSYLNGMKSSYAKAEFAEDDYAVGDKVYHYYGLPRLLVVHSNNSRECVICGANNPYENDRCFYCGHSIIKKTF